MSKIIVLDELTINKIAAGEVVDRPQSIVKELIENSIDAGATEIKIEIKNGGIKYIKITDNGCGFESDDLEIAFESHATSKIRQEEDILNIKSMGFRGEALASIAAIAKATLVSKNINEEIGNKIVVEAGKVLSFEHAASKTGSSIKVENIFYNVPARYKFLKKDSTEASYIETAITRLALINPNIAFTYINNGKQELLTIGNGNITDVIYNIFGKSVKDNLLQVEYNYENIKIKGIVGTPILSRSSRKNEFTYINSRYVVDKIMIKAIENAFDQKLSIGKFPFAVINVEMIPSEVDVNVHPAKLEVKFEDEQKVYKAIYYAIKETLFKYSEEISPFKNTIENNSGFKYIKEEITENNVNEKTVEINEKNQCLYETTIKTYEVNKNINQNILSDLDKNQDSKIQLKENNNEIFEENILNSNDKIVYKYIGNIFNTYIIIEIGSKMYIIDQHAAHERLLYENIKENYYSKNRQTQMLLIPEIIELTSSEMNIVKENETMFDLAGFVMEEFGDKELKITGVPNIGYNIDYKEMFKDIIDELMQGTKTTTIEKETRFIYTLACKAAVKGNVSISKEEQITLIDKMITLKNPFTCPHGRPTAYEMTKDEIEKRFLRK